MTVALLVLAAEDHPSDHLHLLELVEGRDLANDDPGHGRRLTIEHHGGEDRLRCVSYCASLEKDSRDPSRRGRWPDEPSMPRDLVTRELGAGGGDIRIHHGRGE